MLRLMFDNLVIAEQRGTVGNLTMELLDGVHPFFIPKHLFLLGKRSVPMLEFVKFVEQRVFPKERMDCKELLEKLGLTEYKPFQIAEKTKACLMEDGWWVAFSEEDTFREDTTRGRAGFLEWESISSPVHVK